MGKVHEGGYKGLYREPFLSDRVQEFFCRVVTQKTFLAASVPGNFFWRLASQETFLASKVLGNFLSASVPGSFLTVGNP